MKSEYLGRRVLVIGCCGAGKSTLAKRLADATGLPLIHLDCLYWKPNWQHVTEDELHARIEATISRDKWIMDGNFSSTLEWRLSRCDSVVWLDYSRFTCLLGVLHRWKANRKDRSDITQGCNEHWDWSFLRFVWTFKKKHNNRYARLLEEAAARGVNVARFRNRKMTNRFVTSLQSEQI